MRNIAENRVYPHLGKDDQLFPTPLTEIKTVTKLELEHPNKKTYSKLLESTCGTTDDSQDVESYDGTLGVSVEFVETHQSPVGRVQWNNNLNAIYTMAGNVSGESFGSGTLISPNLFLTAGHLFDQTGGGWIRPFRNGTNDPIPPAEIATNMHVDFNYQFDPNGNLRQTQSFPITQLVEYREGGLDYAIVRIGGNPSQSYRIALISKNNSSIDEIIAIIGHPQGVPKRIEAGHIDEYAGNYMRYNDIDTLGGNSGSGILSRASNGLVGVHTNGGCTSSGGFNSGVHISAIIKQSQTIRGVIEAPLQIRGKITHLRVNDVGTGYGPSEDFIDVEVVVKLDSDPQKAFGFQLRNNNDQLAHRDTLNILRDAFNHEAQVLIDYVRIGFHNGRIVRVTKVV